MTERIGFVGLGIMGAGMSRRLLEAGSEVTVWNRTPSRAEPLAAAGAAVASSLPELAATCDVVVVCVGDTQDVIDVVAGPGGIIEGIGHGGLVVDCSTISPDATRTLGKTLGERDVRLVDAPVSGGSEGARDGTLSVMLGGDAADVALASRILAPCAARLTHVGPLGAGQAAKLVNQILVVVNMLAVSEALVFAAAHRLDLERTLDAVAGGAAGSWMLANRGPQVIADDWRPGFTVDLQLKDLRLVREAAAQAGVPLIATSLVDQLYTMLQAEGAGAEGNHALIKAVERLAGIEARTGR